LNYFSDIDVNIVKRADDMGMYKQIHLHSHNKHS